MNPTLDPYTPAHSVMREVRRRWQRCGMENSVPFERLCDTSPEGELHWFLKLNDGNPRAGEMAPHYTTLYVRIWKHMATAVVCCLAAKEAREKPLRNLLLDALEHCRAVDAIEAQLAQRDLDAHAARVKGGKLRHAANDPARHEAARLLSRDRPASGWPTVTAAARCIEDDLKTFILEKRLSIATGEHLVKTIIGWIKRVPAVRAAFNGDR